jgi:hypothetical protein
LLMAVRNEQKTWPKTRLKPGVSLQIAKMSLSEIIGRLKITKILG